MSLQIMALKPKTAVLQIRLDPELLSLFQQQCTDRAYTTSEVVRRLIIGRSNDWSKADARSEEERLNRLSRLSKHIPTSAPTAPEKNAPSPVKTLTRAQMKKQERLAQGRK